MLEVVLMTWAKMAHFCRRILETMAGIFACVAFVGCAGSSTPRDVALAHAKSCKKGDISAARHDVAPELVQDPCPSEDTIEKQLEGAAGSGVTFYYRAKIGHAELSRLDGAAYALHIDELTDRRRAEYTVQRLKDCIRFEKTGELYELLSSSLTQSVSIDKLQKSFDDRPDIWNAIYAALAAQPKFDLQINHKSAHCQASDHKIALVVEDGIWKIADIEGVF